MAGMTGMTSGTAAGMAAGLALTTSMMGGAAARNQRATQLAAEEKEKQRRENDTFTRCAIDSLRSALRCKEVLKIQGVDLMEDSEFTELLAQLNGIEYGFGAKEVFRKLQQTLTDGTYREKFPVGRILPDKWTDPKNHETIDAPLRIVDYRGVKLANGSCRMAAILLRQHATKEEMFFHKEKSAEWKSSEVRWYLNRDYLGGCSEQLKEALAEIKIGGVGVKFFTPSLEELHILDDANNESLSWEYFLDTSINAGDKCKKRMVYTNDDDDIDVCYWTRTPSKKSENRVWYLNYGCAYESGTAWYKHCLPACVIVGE